ncbi:uncharacterized protein EHS24_008821 [Apiotrichum porosum]|uniref:Nucleoporin n=1 Tax=Apiotrichum porosum TaxID=105984 RepID=A0A427XN76_9TREE|nr:uncharacterized protein EHS24_008821 [Apiotrichum porosum]RSH80248.1 hypothetical protein EHS24_008821 [Apiotrichum porosum]
MSRLPLAQWDPSLFTELQTLLALVATQPTTSLVRRLFTKLDEARPWILALTALPTPNEEDKKFISASPIATPDGAEVRITDELLVTTNTIADNLNVSHLLAAILALRAVQARPRFPSRSDPEIAVYVLHEALQALLDFVKELLRLTVGPEAEAGEPFDDLRVWVYDLLDDKGAGGYVGDVVTDQIDAIQARLATLVRSQASGAALELVNFRVAALRGEQNRLAGILDTLAISGLLKVSQVVKIVKSLKKCTRPDAVAASVLAAFFAATPPIDSFKEDVQDARIETVAAYVTNGKLNSVVTNIIFGETFAVEPIREALRVHWSLYLTAALAEEPSLQTSVGIEPGSVEKQLYDGVAAGAFQFIAGLVNQLHATPEDPTYALASRSDADNDQFLLNQLDTLVHNLARKRGFVRIIKNREEDTSLRRSSQAPPSANYQAFLSLIAAVYTNLPPDSAGKLWDETQFTGVAFDLRSMYPAQPFWDMINAISVGPACATKCYEKLKDTRLSWQSLFKFFEHYVEIMPHFVETVKTNRQTSSEPMQEDEFLVAQGWTKLLATIVGDSALARGALLTQPKPHPIQTLFAFVNCDIPADLKATVFEAITAFVKRRGDSTDDDVVARAVTAYESISFADPTMEVREGTRLPQSIGWISRMEYNEQEVGAYPLTRAYIGFLTALIPSDKPKVNNALRRGAIYIIDYVVERVLVGIRQTSNQKEYFEVLDSVLAFFERAIQCFDLTDLLTPARGTAQALADQPGFLVLLRLLSDPAVFAPLANVVDHANLLAGSRPKVVTECLGHVLRLYHRILDVQLVFSDVLLLTLQSSSGFKRPLGFQSIDQYLLSHLSNVTAIALLVGDDDLAVSFVALKIIYALAQSPLFSSTDVFRGEYSKAMNRLAGIIDASDESLRIAQAFCIRLEAEGEDLAPEEVEAEAKKVLRGDESSDSLPVVIRSTILDLLVDGTAESSSPNIAHFLLGFDFRARELGLQDPRSPSSRLSCLGVILEQLNTTPPMIQLHPVLAAKCAQLIHQLFANTVTGPTTMSYAESYHAFPARQLEMLPRTCPTATREVPGMGVAATYTDTVETSAGTLVAYLDFERYILASVALQTFAFEGHGASSEFVAALLLSDEGDEDDDQRPPLLIDLVSTVDITFTETDAGDASQSKVLEFYSGFQFDSFKRPDSEWFDLEMLSRALRSHRRQLERQGAVIPGTSADAMAAEADYILRRLAIKNRETDIAIAKGSFFTAWNEALKVSLAMLFHYVPEDRQEVLIFELLDAVLDRLNTDLAPGVLEILSEAVLVSFTTLANLLSSHDATNLPIDRLSTTLLKVVDGAVRPGTTETARGNLYAAVSQYLQLVPADAESALHKATVAALSARKDRFVSVLCRDAMDMRDVWKTECFSLLAAVVSLGDRGLVSPLTQGGFLAQFVRSVKDREMALQECLSPEPENLHAFWVYETKVAFLTAYAATAKGADDLVEAGVFQTFAMCGFITVQPFSEDVLDDTIASETVHRQHHVLIAALQLLVRVLSSPTRSGPAHALSFLNAHRESFLVLLRENQAYVTPTGIDESRLIVGLMCLIVPKVSAKDLREPSAFGAFHFAVLSLAARFFDRSWVDSLHDADPADGDSVDTQAKVLALNQVIIAYLCATTVGLKAGQGSPVLVLGAARPSGTKYIGSAPSLPQAVELVADLAEAATDVGAAYDDVADKLEAGEEVSVPGLEADTIEELQAAFSARIGAIYNMIESLLLLIWRHMLYYATDAAGESVRPDTLSLSFSTAALATNPYAQSTAGQTNLKALERVAASLRGVLDRLDDVESISGGGSGKKEDAYGAMLVRRLRELCAGLIGE